MRMINFKAINAGVDHDTYLITQDANLFTLFKTCQLNGALSDSGQPIVSFMSHDYDIQYKDEFILEGVKESLETFFFERVDNNSFEQLDINQLYELKAKLESDMQERKQ